jgi:hypothetical protein
VIALVVAAVVLALVTVVLARVVRVLDDAELALRALAGQLRTIRRVVEAVAPLAGAVVRDSAAGEAGLARLEALKAKTGEGARPSGTVGDGDGVGPVSLPLRPSPNRLLPPPARTGRERVDRNPDQRGPRRP